MALQAMMTLIGLSSSAATEAVLCVLLMIWWAFRFYGASPTAPIELKPDPFDNEASKAPAGIAKVPQDLEDDWRQCDLEFDALCESTMGDQNAKVLQDLEEFGWGPVAAHTASDFEANVELHCDRALESMRSHAKDADDAALDGMCAAVLKNLEDEYTGSGAMDTETQGVYV